MARGILELAGLAVTLAFAAPVALFGVEWLLAGKPLGAVFVGFAVGMVAVEEYLVGPKDFAIGTVGRVVGAVAKTPDDED